MEIVEYGLTGVVLFFTHTDLGLVDEIRGKMPVQQHRRRDLFGSGGGGDRGGKAP